MYQVKFIIKILLFNGKELATQKKVLSCLNFSTTKMGQTNKGREEN